MKNIKYIFFNLSFFNNNIFLIFYLKAFNSHNNKKFKSDQSNMDSDINDFPL
jgi:hypothetical protein